MYSIRDLIRQAINSACPLCGLSAAGGDLCAGCLNDLTYSRQSVLRCARCAAQTDSLQTCSACLQTPRAFTHTVAAMEYAFPGALLVRGLKARGCLSNAGLLARLLAQSVSTHAYPLPELKALVPIPSGSASLRKRGFNPACEIARVLSPCLNVPLRRTWLRRTRETELQKTLSAEARKHSVQGLYACDLCIPGVWVGVVDDVMTSCSTMHAAALTLIASGALGVVALVAARTPWQNSDHVSCHPRSARNPSQYR